MDATHVTVLVVVMRWSALVLSAYHLVWLTPAICTLIRRRSLNYRIATHAALSLFMLSFALFQAQFFIDGAPGMTPIARIMGLGIQLVGMVIMVWLSRHDRLMRRLDIVLDALGPALAIAQLARVAPEEADRMADRARALVAEQAMNDA